MYLKFKPLLLKLLINNLILLLLCLNLCCFLLLRHIFPIIVLCIFTLGGLLFFVLSLRNSIWSRSHPIHLWFHKRWALPHRSNTELLISNALDRVSRWWAHFKVNTVTWWNTTHHGWCSAASRWGNILVSFCEIVIFHRIIYKVSRSIDLLLIKLRLRCTSG